MKCTSWMARILEQTPKELGLLYILTFFLLLPIICMHMPHSLYHIRTRSSYQEEEHLLGENSRRLAENQPIIDRYNESVIQNIQSGPVLYEENIDVGITVITVSRNRHIHHENNPKYLTQVVGRLLHLLNTTTRNPGKRYGLFLCNVDSDPENFNEMKPLKLLLPTFQKFHSKHNFKLSIFEKEKRDYVFCLEQTLKQNASFAFLIEDDGYPHRDLLPVLERVIDDRLAPTNSKSLFYGKKSTRRVTYVKFYHPERLLGYISFEWERIPELIAVSLVFGSILTYMVMHFLVQWKRNNIRVIWFACVFYCFLVALVIGRVNLLEMRRISPQMYQVTSAPSCCTPAMLFPRDGGRQIVEQLKAVQCRMRYGKDTALEDIRRKEGYIALMVQPNLFKHIGLFSSLRSGSVDPFMV